MNYKIILIFIVLFFSCKKKEQSSVVVIGHGGNGLEFEGSIYHGNSKEAMDFTFANPNADGVELDLRMAADGSLWLSHDETLETETKSTGCVGDKNEEELAGIKYNSLQNEKLAKLTDIISFQTSDKSIFVDVKHANTCQNNIQEVATYLAVLDEWKQTISNSNKRIYIILNTVDWTEPFILAGWQVLYSSDDSAVRNQLTNDYPSIKGFVCKNSLCSKIQVNEIKSKGKEIYLYEVRSPKSLKEVREKNPTGVMSDDVQGAILEFK